MQDYTNLCCCYCKIDIYQYHNQDDKIMSLAKTQYHSCGGFPSNNGESKFTNSKPCGDFKPIVFNQRIGQAFQLRLCENPLLPLMLRYGNIKKCHACQSQKIVSIENTFTYAIIVFKLWARIEECVVSSMRLWDLLK